MIISRKTDLLLDTALWFKALQESNNDAFIPLFFDQHRYLVLKGGGGSGKSIFAGRKVLERCTTEPGHRYLVCRKVAKTLRESCFEQLRGQTLDYYPNSGYKINKTDMSISFANGSKILFAGLDDVEKLKSIYDITGIWIEEASELSEADFNQLDIRLRTDFPYYKQIILSFNPISITHWLKKRFWDHTDPRATVHESTYKDNRFLIPEAIQTLENFAQTDEYYYMVYALGQWGVTGKTVFVARLVSQRLQKIQPPVMRGEFAVNLAQDGIHITSWVWTDDAGGAISVYKKPQQGHYYVIGGDTAGEGSDWFAAQVLDNATGEQVAVLRHQYDEDTFSQQVYCLGKYYNEALIGCEVNYSTYPTKLLGLMGYDKQYVREVEDDYTGRIKHAYGFRTDRLTRPVIIANLVRLMREHIDNINDETTLQEMLTFVRNDELRPEAEPGAHDDTILSLAIAYYIGSQQRRRADSDTKDKPKNKWTADMWHDYNAASQADRAVLISMWGQPN